MLVSSFLIRLPRPRPALRMLSDCLMKYKTQFRPILCSRERIQCCSVTDNIVKSHIVTFYTYTEIHRIIFLFQYKNIIFNKLKSFFVLHIIWNLDSGQSQFHIFIQKHLLFITLYTNPRIFYLFSNRPVH